MSRIGIYTKEEAITKFGLSENMFNKVHPSKNGLYSQNSINATVKHRNAATWREEQKNLRRKLLEAEQQRGKYSKEEILGKYHFLEETELPAPENNGLYSDRGLDTIRTLIEKRKDELDRATKKREQKEFVESLKDGRTYVKSPVAKYPFLPVRPANLLTKTEAKKQKLKVSEPVGYLYFKNGGGGWSFTELYDTR
jgi:hypothetical protein